MTINETIFNLSDRSGSTYDEKSKYEDNKDKMIKILTELRETLGLPSNIKRTKIINIYWSTGKLLELANVKKIEIDKSELEIIKKLREIKSELKRELKLGLDEK